VSGAELAREPGAAAAPAGRAAMRPLDLASILLVQLLWGFNFPVAKLGMTELPPLLFTALRFALVAALLCPFFAFPRGRLKAILLLSLSLGSIHFSLMFTGLSRIEASTAALLTQSQVIFAALLARAFFGDRLGARGTLGLGIALAGVALIVGQPRFGDDPAPVGMILLAALVWAVGNIQVKAFGPVDPFALTGWIAFFAWPQILLLSLLVEEGHAARIAAAGLKGWGGIAYAAVAVTIGSYWFWYTLVRRYDINQTMPFTLLVPVIGVAASALVLGEALGWQEALGGAATILGVAIIVLRRRGEAAR
jgi:O-acetylserine/cysteine efflux transporter